ncbi:MULTISPECIES: hypothetical protein [Virgibacillus]|nr:MULTISPECIES: hypothetical protein [Virgibacillus]
MIEFLQLKFIIGSSLLGFLVAHFLFRSDQEVGEEQSEIYAE